MHGSFSRIPKEMKNSIAFQDTLGHIRPQSLPEVQAIAATGIAERLLGTRRAKLFVMTVDPDLGPIGKDTFAVIYISSPLYRNHECSIRSMLETHDSM